MSTQTKRDFVAITDFSESEIRETIKLAIDMKRKPQRLDVLAGKTVGCIFHKASLRTRISFEVGIYELGGYSLYITEKEIELGKRESIYDAAKVLSRYLGMIEIRTFSHSDVEQLAKHADIPVINGLTDLLHPCQIMSDMQTITEHKGKIDNMKIAYLGDGNNMANSWLKAASRLPLDLRIGTSKNTPPNAKILDEAQKAAKSKILVTENSLEAVAGADVIYTDVWASMGEKHLQAEKEKHLKAFQINSGLLESANPEVIVMHCLPANRGQEITDEVIDGPHSVVFDQAENRLHMQKAIMVKLARDSF
ncbi:MAG: ornithine carbamoyltransferase [candidate division Zixibacteria bacterium]|nr:ornithine carbamoyltransferase [candidate division Zixibacteria bacterium]